jgi:hypothetical protein
MQALASSTPTSAGLHRSTSGSAASASPLRRAALLPPPSAGRERATTTTTTKNASSSSKPRVVNYGADWYAATREASRPSNVREELARRKAANEVTYRDRRLNSDAWEGSEYRGSRWNILTLLAALFVLVPVLGLAFAYQTYGVLWG